MVQVTVQSVVPKERWYNMLTRSKRNWPLERCPQSLDINSAPDFVWTQSPMEAKALGQLSQRSARGALFSVNAASELIPKRLERRSRSRNTWWAGSTPHGLDLPSC